jgi:catechol 2,3-dioxygenase-like lactoylglutathione lyase family enzyme
MAQATAQAQAAAIAGLHHVGVTVASLDEALKFWEAFLGRPARWRTVLDSPYLSRVVGYPGASIKAAFVDLPGGAVIELLDYHRSGDRSANPEATANPGNVHLCLAAADLRTTWAHAVACGARPVSPDGPVDIEAGPNQGAKAAYLRIHENVTLELFQPAIREPSST